MIQHDFEPGDAAWCIAEDGTPTPCTVIEPHEKPGFWRIQYANAASGNGRRCFTSRQQALSAPPIALPGMPRPYAYLDASPGPLFDGGVE